MRKLMCFVIGFAVSCGLCAYGRESAWMLPGGIAAVVLTVGVLFLLRRKELLSPAIGVLAGCIGGLVWFSGFYLIYLHPVSVLAEQVSWKLPSKKKLKQTCSVNRQFCAVVLLS